MSVQIYTSKPMHFLGDSSDLNSKNFEVSIPLRPSAVPASTRFLDCRARRLLKLSADRDEPTSPTSPLSQIHRVIGSVSWLQWTKGEAESDGSMMSSKRNFPSNFRSSNLRFDGFILLLGMIESAVHSGGLFKLLSRIDFENCVRQTQVFQWHPAKMYAKGPKGSASSVFNESDLHSGVLNESMNSSLCVGWNSEYESRKTHEGSST